MQLERTVNLPVHLCSPSHASREFRPCAEQLAHVALVLVKSPLLEPASSSVPRGHVFQGRAYCRGLLSAKIISKHPKESYNSYVHAQVILFVILSQMLLQIVVCP